MVQLLLENTEPLMSAAVADRWQQGFEELRQREILVPAGYEPFGTVRDTNEEEPVRLLGNADGSFGFYDGSSGWIGVPPTQLTRHRLDMPAFLSALSSEWGKAPIDQPAIIPDVAWDLGQVRVPNRYRKVSIWFARRLASQDRWRAVRQAMVSRPAEGARLVLTSTPPERIPSDPPAWTTIGTLSNVIDDDRSSVSLARVSAVLDHPAGVELLCPVQFFGNGEQVNLYGEVFRFAKGAQQRRVLQYLHEQLLKGRNRVSSAEIVAELDLKLTTRMRDLFKGNPAWGRLLDEKDGLLGFCL